MIAEHYFKKCCITDSQVQRIFMYGKTWIFLTQFKKKKTGSEELDAEYEEVLGIHFVYSFHKRIMQLKSIFK